MNVGVNIHQDHEYARRIAQLENHFDLKKKLDAQIIEHLSSEKRALYIKISSLDAASKRIYEEIYQFLLDKIEEGKLSNERELLREFESEFKERLMKGTESYLKESSVNKERSRSFIPSRTSGQANNLNAQKNEEGRTGELSDTMARVTALLERTKNHREFAVDSKKSANPYRQAMQSKVNRAFDLREGNMRKRLKTPDRAAPKSYVSKSRRGEDESVASKSQRGLTDVVDNPSRNFFDQGSKDEPKKEYKFDYRAYLKENVSNDPGTGIGDYKRNENWKYENHPNEDGDVGTN